MQRCGDEARDTADRGLRRARKKLDEPRLVFGCHGEPLITVTTVALVDIVGTRVTPNVLLCGGPTAL
jgi:hypothetical protein